MKKFYLGLLSTLVASSTVFAQLNCGYTDAMNKVYKMKPELKAQHEAHDHVLSELDKKAFLEKYKKGYPIEQVQKAKEAGITNGINGTVYIVPIVFHILHNDGSERIDESQVLDQVNILNRDFRMLNADTTDVIPSFQSIRGDAEIEFRLATKDPNGNCTNGIVYHKDTRTDWDNSNYSYYAYSGTGSGKWDPRKYLNIYVVKTINSGAAGYTYKPGTWSAGAAQDAIVILHDYVGSIGTGSEGRSRALTHEIGHWFNLSHTWGNTNQPGVACGDDSVNDTPETEGYTFCPSASAPSTYQICNAGISENYQNYMDYSYCCMMFTQGQITRMRTALTSGTSGRNNLWTTSNQSTTGIDNPQVCVPIADFVSDRKVVCAGSPVIFNDNSTNATPNSWSWSFTGGTPTSSSSQSPSILYNTVGQYAVTYTATSTAGSNAITKTSYVTVVPATAPTTTAVLESFETGTFPATNWNLINPTGVAWAQTSTAGYTGTNSIWINNFQNATNEVDEFILPAINVPLINGGSAPSFTFKHAFRQKYTTQVDKLQVLVSTDCGKTWISKLSKSGTALASVTTTSTTAFTPASQTEWKNNTVSLNAYVGEPNLLIKFVFTADPDLVGNNIYIDDINLNYNVGIEEITEESVNFQVFPVPSSDKVNINLDLPNSKHVVCQVFDVLGRNVETLVNGNLNQGEHRMVFGSKGNVTKGIYFVVMMVDGKKLTKRIIIQ